MRRDRSVSDKLNNDDYTCNDALRDCPFFALNTCPLCICGLLPVIVVCISAILHKDYVTHVTDFGAKLVGEIGLSYTVHYTASCHTVVAPPVPADSNPNVVPRPCNPEWGSEVSAAEYDAISGSIMRVRNITNVRAKTLSAVKVTPDWRFVLFVGNVKPEPAAIAPELNVYVVGAAQKKAEQVAPILSQIQLSALQDHCGQRAAEIFTEDMARKEALAEERAAAKKAKAAAEAQTLELQKLAAEVRQDQQAAQRAANLAKSAEHEAKSAEQEEKAETAQVSEEKRKAAAALAEAEKERQIAKEAARKQKLEAKTASQKEQSAAQQAKAEQKRQEAESEAKLKALRSEEDAMKKKAADAIAKIKADEEKIKDQRQDQRQAQLQAQRQAQDARDDEEDGKGGKEAQLNDESVHTSRRLLSSPIAHLVGFKNLQVVLQPFVTVDHDGEIIEAPAFTEGPDEGPVYRLAMAVQCEAELPSLDPAGQASKPLEFSQLAVVDFELVAFNQSTVGLVRSALLPLNVSLNMEDSGNEVLGNFKSQSQTCPRFVPSTRGSKLLFVADGPPSNRESLASSLSVAGETPTLQRRLAITDLPTGNVIKSEDGLQAAWLAGLTGGVLRGNTRRSADSKLLPFGEALHDQALPNAPIHGCPEFVPSLYATPHSITDTMMENVKKFKEKLLAGKSWYDEKAKPHLEKYKLRDTFVFTSNTLGSASVLGVDAQVVAASLDRGKLSNVHLLYNVDAMPQGVTSGLNTKLSDRVTAKEQQLLRLEGCKPIRAAGRKGHMRLEWAFETLLTTLRVQSERGQFTTWLACTTADQKVAIVQSPKRAHWVNMSMPYPAYGTQAASQNVWCYRNGEDECFEVWSSPNPNEMDT